MPTIVQALNIVAILCALYITWKAYQDSLKWGLFFLLTPVVFYALSRFIGAPIAGVVVIGLQLYYVKNNWRAVGVPYAVMVVAWLGALLLPRLVAA